MLKNCITCKFCDTEIIIVGKPSNNIETCGYIQFKHYCKINNKKIGLNDYLSICKKYEIDNDFLDYIKGDNYD